MTLLAPLHVLDNFRMHRTRRKLKSPISGELKLARIHLKPMLAMPVSNQFWMGFRKSLKPSWINKTNLPFVMLVPGLSIS